MSIIKDQPKTEEKWYQFWEKSGYFKADPTSAKPPYSLLMPPPNLTGDPHLGHAMQHAILDALARFKRMQGFDVLLLPGVDHAGIQFEGTLDKILAKEGLSKQKLGREKWLEKAWKFRDEVYKTFHSTWTIFGISADWSREVFTLEPKVQKAVLEEFKTFWDQDLLYKGAYIVQWCPKDQTAIEDLEMEYQERKEKLYYIQYSVILNDSSEGSQDLKPADSSPSSQNDNFITVATARPETIYADVAIAIYPNHPKFSKFLNKFVINPLNGSKIPVIEDKRVHKDFGSGALKITPGHDPLDYEIGKDHNLPILHAVDKTGRMTELAGDLKGLKVNEARVMTEEKLDKSGAIEKIEKYLHKVPVCERCKTTIEPLISEEWFVKIKPLAQKALKNLDKIRFFPKNYQKIISDWLKEIHDWSISRSLWWGHRIPVWYCQKCNPNHEVGKDKDMVISLDEPGKTCQSCGEKHWVQDDQVLDTWFSSGLWPMATLGWSNKTPEFQKYFPWDFELSGGEIKYLWIARMIILSLWFTDKIPFKNMFFHGMIRDLQGRKFSKSLGNGIDASELINQWGVDATRMAHYSYSAPGRDGKASRQTMDERCKNFRNFATKLKNITHFIVDLKPANAVLSESVLSGVEVVEGPPDVIPESSASRESSQTMDPGSQIVRDDNKDDKEIIEKLNKTITEVTKNMEKFELHLATETIYDFIWHEFADKYIESAKDRRAAAQPTLEFVFKTSLQLLHPFMPFTTENLFQKLAQNETSIMLSPWPKIS